MVDQGKPTKAGSSRGAPNLELFRRRVEKGLSRGELGRLANITGKQVGLIERGIATHSREKTMKALAKALETSPDVLFDIDSRLL